MKRFHLPHCALALLLFGSSACAELILKAAEHGLVPGEQEAGTALRALIGKAREAGGSCTIELEKGQYHFYARNAVPHKLYISNHDQQAEHPVGIALTGLEGFTLKGNGAELIFHGRQLPMLVMDSEDTSVENLSIRYITPFNAEGRIVEQAGNSTTLEFAPGSSRWGVEGGKFFNIGNGWRQRVQAAIAFLPDGRMVPTGKPGDIVWTARAHKLSDTRVSFDIDSRKLGLGPGNVLVLRSYWRPNPAILLYRAKDTTLEDVTIHDSMGMGILAQRSEDVTIKGGGVIRREGRYGTTGADATHFSNCKGHICVENALFEGMMDDAINVHATSLGIIDKLDARSVRARYMHKQAYGFEVVQAGERVQFIHGPTLENDPQVCTVESVEMPDPRTVTIRFREDIPAGIGKGDALENADWHPSVSFRHNTVRHNRARGALFTTPEAVRVEHNKFLWSSGSAILLAGDAQGWYESGRCRDVVIRRNVFDHNLTSTYQFTDAVIAICPEVKEPGEQKERYHENIAIEKNVFRTHRVPLLSAVSAENVSFRRNKVIYDDAAPMLFEGEPYRIQHCGEMKLQEVEQPR